jgi:hypothetical protein
MKYLPILFVLLSASPVAGAASFDCQKAKAADERAICAHLTLNDKGRGNGHPVPVPEGAVGDGCPWRASGRPAELGSASADGVRAA